jgi:hypothetical protein
MNDDVVGMSAFLLFSLIYLLSDKMMQIANAILAGVTLFHQEVFSISFLCRLCQNAESKEVFAGRTKLQHQH